MNNSYSIKDIINLLLSKLWLLILVTIIGGTAAFCYSKFVMPLKYSSHISMYVQSYTGISENANQQNNISNSKQLVNTYMEVLKDDAVMNSVGELLKKQFDEDTLIKNFGMSEGRISPSAIRDCYSISSVTDTSAVKIVATTKNAEVAAALCNDLTEVAPDYVEEAVGVGSINTIDVAKVYNNPVAPNMKKNAVLGAMAALMLTCMIIFLVDFFDNTVRDTDAVGKEFKKPIIGEIASFGIEKKKKDQDEDDHVKLTDKNVPFTVVESYKSIRTNVSFALSTVDKKIFAVSSSNPREGKSTTSANIAIALAQGGNKILLIDADMRKAVQHKIFGLKNKKGLSSAISKMSKLEECIQKDVMENLDVMTAGPVPPNPSELLASDNMGAILEQLSSEYSMILIDTPPVNVVTDAMELAKYISGIIVVLRYGVTTNEDVDAAIKKVEFAQMNMLGFIMNDVKIKKAGYYSKYKNKYYYKKGYGYGGYGYYGSKPETSDDDTDVEEKEETVKKEAAPKKTNNNSNNKSKKSNGKKKGKK
ncbi:MAG: polysaccharide biosynthesis tyrosine autokinase [Ruminococcus sp.]|uniref:polysaccharide biosynthesis tyrosine autokinase n=1 Tax=Ruminococcus sp. TaxID=41978 RepID=UPI0025FB2D52|nr:polysaccharide biosynthesis tyrosine autokinase [Ruminococcus sp.]MCR4796509.1 polysaccharide biosynthesis tyrosine autokinase [Ruminococcus sp.]